MNYPIRILELRCVKGSGGGPEKTIFLTAQKMNPSRFKNHILYIRAKKDPEFNLMQKNLSIATNDVFYHEIVEEHAFDLGIISQIIQLCRTHKIDVIHSHEYKTDVIGWFVKKKYPVKWVSTFHLECRGSIKMNLYQFWAYQVLKRADLVMAVSQSLSLRLIQKGIPANKIKILANGVDTDVFSPLAQQKVQGNLRVKPEDVLIGFVGRLSHQKNLPLLLRAFSTVTKCHPNTHLILAGEGPEKSRISNLTNSLNLENNIHMLGFVEDVRIIYNEIDIAVNSADYEGMPNSILEAMAMEKPVVATAVDGVSELVENNVEGFLCDPGDQQGLSEKLGMLVADSEKRIRMGKMARRKVIEQFSFTDRIHKLEDIYSRLYEITD